MRRGTGGRILALLSCCMCLALFAGCQNNMWWDYRDDPYIADLAKQGEADVLRHVNSPDKDDRQKALRIIANQAYEARRDGRREEAERLENIIIRRYQLDKDQDVRACIVRICAPAVGRGSDAMVKFLRERIAAGEYPGYAALSLASLAPKDIYIDIEPLTRHPAHEVRLQAAIALVVLADPRGFDSVAKVWRSMESPPWPEKVEGVNLADARVALALRARRGFGRPLF